jgi:hypothetical protein
MEVTNFKRCGPQLFAAESEAVVCTSHKDDKKNTPHSKGQCKDIVLTMLEAHLLKNVFTKLYVKIHATTLPSDIQKVRRLPCTSFYCSRTLLLVQ